jgi:hypothetical protein
MRANVDESVRKREEGGHAMLYRIIDPDRFTQCMKHVMRAYWPQDRLLALQGSLPGGPLGQPEDEILQVTSKAIEEIARAVAGERLYVAIDESGGQLEMRFPFLDRFYGLFLERRWEQPYEDPRAQAQNLFRLFPEKTGGNSSRNAGSYNHFVNVVAALARLVMHFTDTDNVRKLFEDRSPEVSAVVYDRNPGMRSFKLMLAGFYHDLGKAVVDPRHAMEGAIILAYHTTSARYRLHQVVQHYSLTYEFDRDDLYFVADLVLFHDHYGTLATGEDGYLPLVNMIDRVKRYSLKHNTNKANQLEWSRRYLFDLWLLNAADIMVSLERKFEPQCEWWDAEQASHRIREFLEGEKAACLVHDLKVTFELLRAHCLKKHSDDLTGLQAAAHDISKRHVVERLRRLMTNSLRGPLARRVHNEQKPEPQLSMIARRVLNLSEENWTATIVRAIQAVGDFGEFTSRLAWIGRMDYALGFFQQIADAALQRVEEDVAGQGRSGWVRQLGNDIEPEYLDRTQALFFADNYVMTVVQILGYLLFREPSIDRLRNIEFSDARSRLTPEKIAQLLSTEGPFRARRAVQAVLQTIYLY